MEVQKKLAPAARVYYRQLQAQIDEIDLQKSSLDTAKNLMVAEQEAIRGTASTLPSSWKK